MKLLSLHYGQKHLPVSLFHRMRQAPEETKIPCPFNLVNMTPCPMSFLLEHPADVTFLSHHMFSHIPQTVHDKVDELFSNTSQNRCPFSYCTSTQCNDMRNKSFYTKHLIEITVLILMMVVSNQSNLIQEIVKFADEDIRSCLETQIEYSPEPPEVSNTTNKTEINFTSVNGEELEEGEISDSYGTNHNTQEVMDAEDERSKENRNSSDLEDEELVNEMDKSEDEDDENTNHEIVKSGPEHEVKKELQIAKRRDLRYKFACSECKSVFLTKTEVLEHTVNFHEQEVLEEDVSDNDDAGENEEHSKNVEVKLFDLSFSKKWNKRICRSWQKFTEEQPDEYLLKHFNLTPHQQCKQCNFKAQNCAEIMKHIRYSHVKF